LLAPSSLRFSTKAEGSMIEFAKLSTLEG
jgi:hypothetical protein